MKSPLRTILLPLLSVWAILVFIPESRTSPA